MSEGADSAWKGRLMARWEWGLAGWAGWRDDQDGQPEGCLLGRAGKPDNETPAIGQAKQDPEDR